MKLTVRPRLVAVAVAAGLVLSAAAGGVGYAAGSSASKVSACVGSKNRLAVQNSKGKCPKKFTKVSIATQGPRGATGARGAAGAKGAPGAKGAQGPGAGALNQIFLFGGSGTPITVAGLTYTPGCSLNGSDVTATLKVTAASGEDVFVRGVEVDGSAGSTANTSVIDTPGATTGTVSVLANGGQSHLATFPGALVLTNTKTQTMTMRIYANPTSGGPFTTHCSFEGAITPAA